MLDTTLFFTVVIALMIGGLLAYLFYLQRKSKLEEANHTKASVSLQLQAYERLVLLVDRIALPNLVNRVNTSGMTAMELQLQMLRTIRDEFDYNITQQLYISPEAWNAVKNLKEKNLMLINQVAGSLTLEASGLDLGRALLDFLVQNRYANLHELVSEALSYEAKKLL